MMLALAMLLPGHILAQETFKTAVRGVVDYIRTGLVPLLFVMALAYFMWGVIEFIRNANNPDDRKKGKQRIFWGIIGLFVMVAYFGLTAVLTETFFDSSPFLPQLFS